MVSITAKDSSLLSNEHESWSISQLKRQRTVMETQQRIGRQKYLTWDSLSCSQGRSRVSSRRKSQRPMSLSAKSISHNNAECHVLCAGGKKKKESKSPHFWVWSCLKNWVYHLWQTCDQVTKKILKVQILWANVNDLPKEISLERLFFFVSLFFFSLEKIIFV